MNRAEIDAAIASLLKYLARKGAAKSDLEGALAGALFDIKAQDYTPHE